MASTREKKKRKKTKRNVSRRPELPFMLKTEEEKIAIPCEKTPALFWLVWVVV